MLGLSLLMWIGVGILYLGFCGVLGVLLRQAGDSGLKEHWLLAVLHGFLIVVPASILVLGLESTPAFVRGGVLLSGALALWLSAKQPTWIPIHPWQVRFGQRYFSIAMAISSAWALLTVWSQPTLGPALLAGAALAASLSSLTKAASAA
jgi:hypothetical protein